MASPERLAAIRRIDQAKLDRLVDAIGVLMERHPEPYRTLAEALILSRGEGAAEFMAESIEYAVEDDLGPSTTTVSRCRTCGLEMGGMGQSIGCHGCDGEFCSTVCLMKHEAESGHRDPSEVSQ